MGPALSWVAMGHASRGGRPAFPLLGGEGLHVLEPSPQVRRLGEAGVRELVVELRVGCRRHEALDVRVALQVGLDVVLDLQRAKFPGGLLAQLQRALLLVRRAARRGRDRGLRRGRGGPDRQIALEGLELAQRLRGRHGLAVQPGHELGQAEGAQRLLHTALADVDGEVDHLLVAHHRDVVPLRQLRLAHLLVQGLAAGLRLRVVAEKRQLLLDVLGVGDELLTHGHDHDLARRQPQRPLAAVVLDEDGAHTLDGAQDGAVDHNGALEPVLQPALAPDDLALRVLLDRALELALLLLTLTGLLVVAVPLVLQVEPDGVVEVELDGAALVLALHGVR
mmetsp:Transcript_63968/g.164659  ORF Transcript_63968/g.164659 Transcript_63968/m.164659 type:complete len:336 (+) Transcript_63968:80-1087(+)